MYKIRDTGPAGGIIFDDMGPCLEAAPADTEFEAKWSMHDKPVGNTGKDIGGWFLPSKDELNLMCIRLKNNNFVLYGLLHLKPKN